MAAITAPYPPAFIRRVLDDVANHGVKPKEIADLVGIRAPNIARWLQLGRIRLDVKAREEDLDSALREITTSGIEKRKAQGLYDPELQVNCAYRDLTEQQHKYVELGFHGVDALPDPRTPGEMAAFAGVLSVVDRQLDMLDTLSHTAESIQEVTATLSAAIALKQLRSVFIDPPRITSWKDVKLTVDMAREALDMNMKIKEVASQQRTNVDVRILEFDPRKPPSRKTVTLDVEVMDKELT